MINTKRFKILYAMRKLRYKLTFENFLLSYKMLRRSRYSRLISFRLSLYSANCFRRAALQIDDYCERELL